MREVSEKIRSKSAVFFISDVHPELPPGIRKILRNSHVFSIRISHPYDGRPPVFGLPVASGFFSRIFRRGAHSAPSCKPSVPSVEIGVGDDAFLPLNRLLSDPHA